MKHFKLIMTFLFIITLEQVFCQNAKISDKEFKQFIRKFVNTIKNNDSLSIMEFRYFFHDIENETQMSIASEYCEKIVKTNCDEYIENIRYCFDQKIIDYFFNKMKKYFKKKDSIIDICRIEEDNKFISYLVTIKTSNKNKKYYINFGYNPFYKNFIKFINPKEREYYKAHNYTLKILPYGINYILDSNFQSIVHKLDTNNYYIKNLKAIYNE